MVLYTNATLLLMTEFDKRANDILGLYAKYISATGIVGGIYGNAPV